MENLGEQIRCGSRRKEHTLVESNESKVIDPLQTSQNQRFLGWKKKKKKKNGNTSRILG